MNFSLKALVLPIAFIVSCLTFAQNTISGTVLDEEGNALYGASVVLKGTSDGIVADENGNFSLQTNAQLPIEVEISFVGFETLTYSYSSFDAQTFRLNFGNRFDEIIVSASRKAEKLQEAPAAVSVLSAAQVSKSGGSISPIRALINTPGVELQQQTGQRIKVSLRGASRIFSTNVFPMLDYRSLISPGLEFFDSQNSPLHTIDLERVEVVLGPGSALYGPDVTTGVIHFISKDPFKHPGTTVELIYGSRANKKIGIRHARKNDNETIGYKFNFRYQEGRDFTLDPNDAQDKTILDGFKTAIKRANITPEGNTDTRSSGTTLFTVPQLQNEDFWTSATSAYFYFRPKNGPEIVTSGGWNAGNAIYYNDLGEGQSQSNEYWGQARLNYKGWFAQTYFIQNDGGSDSRPSYLHQTGFITPLERTHQEAQLQYSFDFNQFFDSEWSAGIDYRNTTANTQNHVYGRHENNDDYNILGGYVQAKLKFGSKLDLFLAGRYDGYNFTDEKTFSPRAAFVYKASDKHNFRLSYNRAANPIVASDIYFDLPTQSFDAAGFDVWVLGAQNPYTFGSDPSIDWLIPGVPNTPLSAGFPLAAAFAAVNTDVVAGISAALGANPSLAPLLPLIQSVLTNPAITPQGFAAVETVDLSGDPFDVKGGQGNLLSFIDAYEIGYKGVVGDRFSFGVDVYHYRRKGGATFQQISPLANIQNLGSSLGQGVRANAEPALTQGLIGIGLDAATAAATAQALGPAIEGAYSNGGDGFVAALAAAGLPFHAIIPTVENTGTGNTRLTLGYLSNDPNVVSEDWGAEFNFKFFLTDKLTTRGNYTWFRLDPENPDGQSFPNNKVRFGIDYDTNSKFYGTINYQWDQSFTSNNATFPGEIDEKSLFDITLGYDLIENLKLELSGINVFNNEFRALPGFPKIGRTITARILVDF